MNREADKRSPASSGAAALVVLALGALWQQLCLSCLCRSPCINLGRTLLIAVAVGMPADLVVQPHKGAH